MRHVKLPIEIIKAYKQAQDAYVRWEDDNREWTRDVLEAFKDALHNIIRAANTDQQDIAASHLLESHDYLTFITTECSERETSSASNMLVDIRLPNSTIMLYEASHKAYLQYVGTVETPLSGLISNFRDALDHIVDAADPTVSEDHTPILLAQADEHLLEVAGESMQLGIADLTRRSGTRGKLKRLIYDELPSPSQTNDRLSDIARHLSNARLLKGKIRFWERCLEEYTKAFEVAYLLNYDMYNGKPKPVIRVALWGCSIGIGAVIGILIALTI